MKPVPNWMLWLAVVLMIAGCVKYEPGRSVTLPDGSIDVVIIEGCEYLYYSGNDTIWCHKGNCTNDIHVYAVENKP